MNWTAALIVLGWCATLIVLLQVKRAFGAWTEAVLRDARATEIVNRNVEYLAEQVIEARHAIERSQEKSA